jgi:hypothetical protein
MLETKSVQITFRIPGSWNGFRELFERLPREFRLTEKGMVMPDGSLVEAYPVPPDDQFSKVFLTACRLLPTPSELEAVERYSANMILVGEGGSTRLAHRMMQAATAILDAGGAGVFIDNRAMSHGGTNWKQMTEDGSPDAISFAFVSIIRSNHHLRTMGMHVLGYPELELTSEGDPASEEALISLIRYVSSGEKPIGHGHLIIDETGLRYRAAETVNERIDQGSPMFNPFGHLKLVSTKEIAENN